MKLEMIFPKGMILHRTYSQYNSYQEYHADNNCHCLEVDEWTDWYDTDLFDKWEYKDTKEVD